MSKTKKSCAFVLTVGLLLVVPLFIAQTIPQPNILDRVKFADTLADALSKSNLRTGDVVVTKAHANAGDQGGNTFIYRASGWSSLSATRQAGPFFKRIGSTDAYLEVQYKAVITAPQCGLFAATAGATVISTINAAFDSIEEEGGGMLKMHPHTVYNCNKDQLVMEDKVVFDCNGATLRNCLIAVSAAADHWSMYNADFFKDSNDDIIYGNNHGFFIRGTNLHIENIRFRIGGTADNVSNAFYCQDVDGAHFLNFHFEAGAGTAGWGVQGKDVHIDGWTADDAQNDDFIALKALQQGCKNFTITNCIVRGAAAGVSIGSQAGRDAPMENIVIDTLSCSNCAYGVYLKCGYTSTQEPYLDGVFRDINIDNLAFTTTNPEDDQPAIAGVDIAVRGNGIIDGVNIGRVTFSGRQQSNTAVISTAIVKLEYFDEAGKTAIMRNVRIGEIVHTDQVPTFGLTATPDHTADTFTVAGTYAAGVVWRVRGISSATLPAGLATGVNYYTVSPSSAGGNTTFGLAYEAGGSPINFTSNGSGTIQAIPVGTPVDFGLVVLDASSMDSGTVRGENIVIENVISNRPRGLLVGNIPTGWDIKFKNWRCMPRVHDQQSPLGGDSTQLVTFSSTMPEVLDFQILGTFPAAIRGDPTGIGSGSGGRTFTADSANDTFTISSHAMFDGCLVQVSSSSALPAGLSALTDYYVRDATTNTFKLAPASNAPAIDITDNGTGTHTCKLESVGLSKVFPGPVSANASYTYTGSQLAIPAWVPSFTVPLTTGGTTPINTAFTVSIPPWTRCYIARIEVYNETSVAMSTTNYGRLDFEKGVPPFSSTRLMSRRSTQDGTPPATGTADFEMTANTWHSLYPGYNVPNFVAFNAGEGTESWIDYDQGLLFRYTPTGTGIPLNNLRARIYYVPF